MYSLPRESREKLEGLLSRLPGLDSPASRRTWLTLVWPDDAGAGAAAPELVESGWSPLVARIAQLPLPGSIQLLRALLGNVSSLYEEGELSRDIAQLTAGLEALATDRSFPMFLARLGLDASKGSDSGLQFLDKVFVPPVQYGAAVDILDRDRIVFLLGDAHMGKTYCAMHLLWEKFHRDGVEPCWIRSPAELDLSVGGTAAIPAGAAIYIEDPFGRTAPIDDPEAVYNSLRRLLIQAEKQHLFVIVTSRTAVLQAAIANRLKDYVVTLSQELLLGTSYDRAALGEIAERYIEIYRPAWAGNKAAAPFAAAITRELDAPHNIQEFVLATRPLSDPVAAMARLSAFKDVVTEYVAVFKRLDPWLVSALVVLAAATGHGADLGRMGRFYDQVDRNRPDYRNFDSALAELRQFLTSDFGRLPMFRHPSIEEAVEALCRDRSDLLEAMWILVTACRNDPDAVNDRIAIDLLVRFADQWSRTPGRLALLDDYFDGLDLEVRGASRRLALNRFSDLHRDSAEILARMAAKSWGDRFLIQIVILPGALSRQMHDQLASRLSISEDSQTRVMLAENLGRLSHDLGLRIGGQLIRDPDGLVAREAIRQIVMMGWDGALEIELAAAVAALPRRHRYWLDAIGIGEDFPR